MIFEALAEAAGRGELLLAEGGLCRFHLRRDGWVTVREILVLPPFRGRGLGKRLVWQAGLKARGVRARCPADLPSNGFWSALGFRLVGTLPGKRPVNVWERPN